MKLSDLQYSFPANLIANHPPKIRGDSRMLLVDRQSNRFEDAFFKDIGDYFKAGDVLVLNNSKVFPARLITKKPTGGVVECLLVKDIGNKRWECFLSSSKSIKKNTTFVFSDQLSGVVINENDYLRQMELHYTGSLLDILKKIGHTPLPPYIKRQDQPDDQIRYQTVYAKSIGSVAAPTAGLHFTQHILDELQNRGIQIATVTLHVGPGTFIPIRCEDLKDHKMHGEYFEITRETAELLCKAHSDKRCITAVGTTTVRVLESAWHHPDIIKAGPGYTEKFIYPPHSFKLVNRLLTNFHQPQSSLLALVSAFASPQLMMESYQHAIHQQYQLFSYGDCMLIK